LVATGISTYLVIEHALTRGTGTGQPAARPPRHNHPASRATQPPSRAPARTVYIVRPGDTLGTIAARFGVTVADIELLNPRLNPNVLQVGQRLRLRQ
jgi:LysM repeat protein